MIPAALVGFSLGTVIAWWVVLRSLSHGERDFEADPLDTVQTTDPYVLSFITEVETPSQTISSMTPFLLDCE